MGPTIPLITLEEHFISQAVLNYYASQNVDTSLPASMAHIMTALREVGHDRLKVMDDGRVALQVISHRPNSIPVPPDVCSAANDELYEAIKASPAPERFAGFAMLPTLHPEEAAKELDRCVSKLQFVGSLIDNTADGRFYDEEFFWPIFAAHEKLDVPCYLHAIPAPLSETTPEPIASNFKGNFSPIISNFLANHGFNWHNTVSLHLLRLFSSKLFDKHPHLKIILGHMGETLPFLLDRIHGLIQRTWPTDAKPRRHLMQVWHENVYITTAGMFTLAPMACLIHMCCADKVLYSVDYPFCSSEDGLRFMLALKESGMINAMDFEAIAYRNAERLLDVKVPERNVVGIDVEGDEALKEEERKKMPWLERDGDVVNVPSPLDVVPMDGTSQ
jgi:predicted TIM-barrel fold metal-dependent hydrolase